MGRDVGEIVAPTFSYELENVSVSRGGTACFKGTVNGSVPFETRWFVNDRELLADSGDERVVMSMRQDCSETFLTGLIDYIISLKVFDCDRADLGKYTAFVRNEAGDASCSAFLVFEGRHKHTYEFKVHHVYKSVTGRKYFSFKTL